MVSRPLRALAPVAAVLAAACNALIGIEAPDETTSGAGGAESTQSSAAQPTAAGGNSGTLIGSSSSGNFPNIACINDHDCDTGNPCQQFSCMQGQCAVQAMTDGSTPTGYHDFIKDCQTKQCIGGVATIVPSTNDAPNKDLCMTYSCNGSMIVATPVASGTHCGDIGPGLKCDGMGNCAGCTNSSQCSNEGGFGSCKTIACDTSTKFCTTTAKAAGASCNGEMGGNVCDGAGHCVECNDASGCQFGGQQQACIADQCVQQCADGMKDGSETDVDCGQGCPYRCGIGKKCEANTDCDSNLCEGGACATGCGDGTTDGLETDVDCGGGYCLTCSNGQTCGANADCVSGYCSLSAHVCATPTCTDGVQNGSETGPDCGGPCPDKCPNGEGCSTPSDCQSTYCVGSVCVSQCQNQVKDGNETDIDCGGSCPNKCAYGQGCAVDGDCVGGSCSGGTCAAACDDGVKNGDETDVDCGGSCPTKCAQSMGCSVDGDCQSGLGCDATGNVCQPVCSDGKLDGDETDVDCGGSCTTKCATGQACLVNGDCTSGTCTSSVCG